MFKKLLSLALIGLLLNLGGVKVYAHSKEEEQARFAEKVKEAVNKLGIGEAARLEVKLKDKRKLQGYISETGEDSFVVTDAKTGTATTIAYAHVKQVKGNNLSTGAKIAIGVGVAVAILALLAWLARDS